MRWFWLVVVQCLYSALQSRCVQYKKGNCNNGSRLLFQAPSLQMPAMLNEEWIGLVPNSRAQGAGEIVVPGVSTRLAISHRRRALPIQQINRTKPASTHSENDEERATSVLQAAKARRRKTPAPLTPDELEDREISTELGVRAAGRRQPSPVEQDTEEEATTGAEEEEAVPAAGGEAPSMATPPASAGGERGAPTEESPPATPSDTLPPPVEEVPERHAEETTVAAERQEEPSHPALLVPQQQGSRLSALRLCTASSASHVEMSYRGGHYRSELELFTLPIIVCQNLQYELPVQVDVLYTTVKRAVALVIEDLGWDRSTASCYLSASEDGKRYPSSPFTATIYHSLEGIQSFEPVTLLEMCDFSGGSESVFVPCGSNEQPHHLSYQPPTTTRQRAGEKAAEVPREHEGWLLWTKRKVTEMVSPKSPLDMVLSYLEDRLARHEDYWLFCKGHHSAKNVAFTPIVNWGRALRRYASKDFSGHVPTIPAFHLLSPT